MNLKENFQTNCVSNFPQSKSLLIICLLLSIFIYLYYIVDDFFMHRFHETFVCFFLLVFYHFHCYLHLVINGYQCGMIGLIYIYAMRCNAMQCCIQQNEWTKWCEQFMYTIMLVIMHYFYCLKSSSTYWVIENVFYEKFEIKWLVWALIYYHHMKWGVLVT